MYDRTLICIGGGEIKTKQTLEIDGYIAKLVKSRVADRRPVGLFIGTASHDSMPYFNSFRKTYTSVYDIKADCALIVYGEMNIEKIRDKISNADFIYIGGGDTLFMLNKWSETGLLDMILDAYRKGTIICGLSAGAICWFKHMFTDSVTTNGNEQYHFYNGLGLLDGVCCPHYDDRILDFDKEFIDEGYVYAYGIENLAALIFVNEELKGSVTCGGNAYLIKNNNNLCEKFIIKTLN